MSAESAITREVSRRVRVIIDALKIAADADYRDKTPEEIRATAVAAAKGPEAIDGRCADAIEAVFDHMLEQVGTDPVRRALSKRQYTN